MSQSGEGESGEVHSAERRVGAGPLSALALDSLLLVSVFLLLQWSYRSFCPLPVAAYHRPSLLFEALRDPAILSNWVFVTWILFLARRELSWDSLEAGRVLRLFVFLLALFAAWSVSTAGLNLYYDRTHYIDRLLLLAATGLLLLHPAFLVSYLWLMFTLWAQARYPIDSYGSAWFERMLPIQLLLLFVAYCVVRSVRNVPASRFVVVALGLTGATYVASAWHKLQLGPELFSWALENKLSNLFVSAYVNGHLGFLSHDSVVTIAGVLAHADVPMQVATLVIEGAGLLLLARRGLAQLCFLGFIALHTGIALASGVFFWKWIVADIALLLLLSRLPKEVQRGVFAPRVFALSVPLIALGAAYLPGAAWWDSKLNQFFEIEVVGDRGTVYSVDRHYFQPYDLRFAQSYHIGLSRDPRIVSTYGTTFNRAAYLKLEQVSQADIGRVIRRRGVSSYNSEYDARFADLMTRFFRNLNRRRDRWLLINYLAAPHHIQQLPERATFAGQTKVRQVRVRRIETFYDGSRIHEVSNRIIKEIEIPRE